MDSTLPVLEDLGFKNGPDTPDVEGFERPWNMLEAGTDRSLRNQIIAAISSTEIDGNVHDSVILDESQGPILIEQGAKIGPFVLIQGPVIIRTGVEVRQGAFVRPYTWACQGSVIGHATEIKHTLLMPGSKAPHFNYVGDSLLASGVNLGAGSVLSNLRHDGAEVMLRLGEENVPTGLRKFGAILGRDVQVGCNAVTNPGTILGSESSVWPNACVLGVHAGNSILR